MYNFVVFREYNQKIKKILLKNNSKIDWRKIFKYHQKMILRIQHERLIHLLVTMFVGIIMIISVFISIVINNQILAIFSLLLIILFGIYLMHYRFLENMTQNWYKIEDEIVSRY